LPHIKVPMSLLFLQVQLLKTKRILLSAMIYNKCTKFLLTFLLVDVALSLSTQRSRREFVSSLTAGATAFGLSVSGVNAEDPDTRDLNAFNTLTFNYRRNDFNGLKASDLNEESISYADFLAKMDGGEVKFVEFYAPDGDVAYATLETVTTTSSGEGSETKKVSKTRIRIGEGYPVEIHDGWSSPAFVIRSVKEKGVRFLPFCQVFGLQH